MKLTLVSVLIGSVSLGSLAAGDRFACNMNALTTTERARHRELSNQLLPAVQEKRELPSGYAFRLSSKDLMTTVEWVSFERKCCPFFAFEIEQAKDNGPLWLRITGAEGVKSFIVEEFGL